ncbi:hypothetical protein JW926_05985 [Candidatus Sumerlaeota bacterium]|nr:hypothetical protein [Candidatus Sumerlaeota bacterium]
MISNPNNLESIIVEEILRFLENLEGNLAPPCSSNVPGLLFILSQPLPEKIDFSTVTGHFPSYLLRSSNYTSSLSPLFSQIKEISCVDAVDFPEGMFDQWKAVILPHPSLTFLAQCALGITPDPASRALLQSLLKAKPVLGIFDEIPEQGEKSLNPLANSNPVENAVFSQRIRSTLLSLHHQYVKTLEDWGVLRVKMDNLFHVIQKIMEPREGAKQAMETSKPPSQRIVITQEDILERIQKGDTHWLAPSNAIVTSLAWEIAEKHGFILKLSP